MFPRKCLALWDYTCKLQMTLKLEEGVGLELQNSAWFWRVAYWVKPDRHFILYCNASLDAGTWGKLKELNVLITLREGSSSEGQSTLGKDSPHLERTDFCVVSEPESISRYWEEIKEKREPMLLFTWNSDKNGSKATNKMERMLYKYSDLRGTQMKNHEVHTHKPSTVLLLLTL